MEASFWRWRRVSKRGALLLVFLAGPLILLGGALMARGQTVLEIPPGARASGMGLAHVAVADDANAAWWNPAGLGFLDCGTSATFTYAPLGAYYAQYYLSPAWAIRIDGFGTIAGHVAYLNYGKSVATDFSGTVIGEFTSYAVVPAFAFGARASENIALGAGLKVERVDLAPAAVTRDGRDGSATSVAFDAGLQWRQEDGRAKVGLVVRNLGPSLSFSDEDQSDPLPRSLTGGVCYWALARDDRALVLATDLEKPLVNLDDGPKLRFGTEYSMGPLTARFGWIYEGWFQNIEPLNDPTFGFGIRLHGISFDYASLPRERGVRDWAIAFGACF